MQQLVTIAQSHVMVPAGVELAGPYGPGSGSDGGHAEDARVSSGHGGSKSGGSRSSGGEQNYRGIHCECSRCPARTTRPASLAATLPNAWHQPLPVPELQFSLTDAVFFLGADCQRDKKHRASLRLRPGQLGRMVFPVPHRPGGSWELNGPLCKTRGEAKASYDLGLVFMHLQVGGGGGEGGLHDKNMGALPCQVCPSAPVSASQQLKPAASVLPTATPTAPHRLPRRHPSCPGACREMRTPRRTPGCGGTPGTRA